MTDDQVLGPDQPPRPGAGEPGPAGTPREAAVLARELRELGRRLEVPAAPDLRAGVRARLADSSVRSPQRLRPTPSRRLRAAAAVLVVLAGLAAGTVSVSPRARAAIADFFGIGPIRVHSGTPPVPPPPSSTPRFGGVVPGTRETTLAAARRDAVFPIAVPALLGTPDQVLAGGGARPEFVALRYGPGPGRPAADPSGIAVELDEFAGTVTPYLDKYLSGGAAERVTVGGGPGIWIDGPHEVIYADRSGTPRFEAARLAARTLIWQRGAVTLRLEGDLSQGEALAIARSMP